MSKSFYKFLILCSGGFVASVGHGISSFGLSVYVYGQTGLASSTTLIALLAFLPAMLLSPLAGVLADKYDRRLLMILGDGLSALGILYIYFCIQRGDVQFWQIGLGVAVSSIFTSLVEPSFRATITDLLSKEEYTKASGFVQLSGSARYLLSPAIAGLLFVLWDIRLLLIIDICTIFITVLTTLVVRRGIVSKLRENKESIFKDFKNGWLALTQNRGVFILTAMGAAITFFIAAIQVLSTPMILSFTDSRVLGFAITICASGMLVSSMFLGFVPLRKGVVKILSASLFLIGLFMVVFGLRENIILICVSGFLFFLTLPFANTSLDYLIRTNVENEVQGRVWGLVGVASQLGYPVAYAALGLLADYVFTPLLLEGGTLAGSIGKITGVGSGRGIGLLIIVSGLLLSATAVLLYRIRSVRKLEKAHVQ
ncbi:MAG: MFS transporter [Oscillospiraceae bacterium]|nr:MFS transporter [Oscillospiraceae bacterium]